ncbi:hypothetical protein K1719_009775 [Acacia pycnantha]|nr:hypothetical protein K1719_009775 [Acacia pycnantha]
MNFFKSVFSDDPDPSQSESASQVPNNAPQNKGQDDPDRDTSPIEHGSASNSGANASAAAGWNFGGLIRNLTVKSESIIETYRRDLQEFGTGLKKEIEVAQGSLENAGHAFDEFGNSLVKGSAQIISQGKDAILVLESDSDSNTTHNQKFSGDKSLNSKAYSRFDAQVRAIQGDASTYCEEPEDLNDYNKWKLEFSLEGKQEEFENYLKENDDMMTIYKKVVPRSVDRETFWYRYYYKVYRLTKAEELRARLVRRASIDDEDLSWDFEDDDGDKGFEVKAKSDIVNPKKVGGEVLEESVDTELRVGSSSTGNEVGTNISNVEQEHHLGEESTVEKIDNSLRDKGPENKGNKSVEESKVEKAEIVHQVDDGSSVNIKESGDESISEAQAAVNKNDSPTESDSKLGEEKKADDGKSSTKGNDSSLVSSQHSAPDEEDLGWDEIEDLSSIDDKKTSQSGSPNKVDLRKRLTAAEEDEDLSWDIEDDDDEKLAKP